MSAKIKLPNGPEASLDDEGDWSCERKDIEAYLQTIAAEKSPLYYLPDPFRNVLDHVVEATGAHILEYHAPAAESEEGAIY